MVNEMEPQKEQELPLAQVLENTKQELLRAQFRLHQLQETTVAEGALSQLRGQYLHSQYELWVMKACVAWLRGEPLRVTQNLAASFDCAALESQSVVADWLRRLKQFESEIGPVLVDSSALRLELLLATSEWQALMKQVMVSH